MYFQSKFIIIFLLFVLQIDSTFCVSSSTASSSYFLDYPSASSPSHSATSKPSSTFKHEGNSNSIQSNNASGKCKRGKYRKFSNMEEKKQARREQKKKSGARFTLVEVQKATNELKGEELNEFLKNAVLHRRKRNTSYRKFYLKQFPTSHIPKIRKSRKRDDEEVEEHEIVEILKKAKSVDKNMTPEQKEKSQRKSVKGNNQKYNFDNIRKANQELQGEELKEYMKKAALYRRRRNKANDKYYEKVSRRPITKKVPKESNKDEVDDDEIQTLLKKIYKHEKPLMNSGKNSKP